MTGPRLFRIEPQLPPHAMKTYSIIAPRSTHWRAATCTEVDCPSEANGWQTLIDESADLGQRQAHYIRKQSGRHFTEHRNEAGVTVFVFTAGQPCFTQHQARVGRPEIFAVRDGDWRGNPRGTEARVHRDPRDWVDDFGEHQQRLADRLEQG